MEIIAKISKGSKMDQIYIPRNRESFPAGSFVIIKLLEEKQAEIFALLKAGGCQYVNDSGVKQLK